MLSDHQRRTTRARDPLDRWPQIGRNRADALADPRDHRITSAFADLLREPVPSRRMSTPLMRVAALNGINVICD